MPGISASARRCRHTAIAFSLCLLVLSCAMEAKFAWYAPPAGPTIDARSTKAIPADTRDLSMEESVRVDLAGTGISCLFLAILVTGWLLTEERTQANERPLSVRPMPATVFYSPQISFRPPPGR